MDARRRGDASLPLPGTRSAYFPGEDGARPGPAEEETLAREKAAGSGEQGASQDARRGPLVLADAMSSAAATVPSAGLYEVRFPAYRGFLWDPTPAGGTYRVSGPGLLGAVQLAISCFGGGEGSDWAGGTARLETVPANVGAPMVLLMRAEQGPGRGQQVARTASQVELAQASTVVALLRAMRAAVDAARPLHPFQAMPAALSLQPSPAGDELVADGAVAVPRATLEITQIYTPRTCDVALTRELVAATRGERVSPDAGVLTMDQHRRILPLRLSDPRALSAPLVGCYVSGATSPADPRVWAACTHFLHCRAHAPRATQGARQGFLLLLATPGSWHLTCYECCASEPGLPVSLLTFTAIVPRSAAAGDPSTVAATCMPRLPLAAPSAGWSAAATSLGASAPGAREVPRERPRAASDDAALVGAGPGASQQAGPWGADMCSDPDARAPSPAASSVRGSSDEDVAPRRDGPPRPLSHRAIAAAPKPHPPHAEERALPGPSAQKVSPPAWEIAGPAGQTAVDVAARPSTQVRPGPRPGPSWHPQSWISATDAGIRGRLPGVSGMRMSSRDADVVALGPPRAMAGGAKASGAGPAVAGAAERDKGAARGEDVVRTLPAWGPADAAALDGAWGGPDQGQGREGRGLTLGHGPSQGREGAEASDPASRGLPALPGWVPGVGLASRGPHRYPFSMAQIDPQGVIALQAEQLREMRAQLSRLEDCVMRLAAARGGAGDGAERRDVAGGAAVETIREAVGRAAEESRAGGDGAAHAPTHARESGRGARGVSGAEGGGAGRQQGAELWGEASEGGARATEGPARGADAGLATPDARGGEAGSGAAEGAGGVRSANGAAPLMATPPSCPSPLGPVAEARHLHMMRFAAEIDGGGSAGGSSSEGQPRTSHEARGRGEGRNDPRDVDRECVERAGLTGDVRVPDAVSVRQEPRPGGEAERRLRDAAGAASRGECEADDTLGLDSSRDVPDNEGAGDGAGPGEGRGAPSHVPAETRFRDALLGEPPSLPPGALKSPLIVQNEPHRAALPDHWPRIRVAALAEADSDMSEDEADSEASRATLRNSVLAHSPSATAHTRPAHAGPSRAVRGGAPEAWARVGLPEEEEEDDESMVIAMKYLGDPAFRKALLDTGDSEMLGYLKTRKLL